MRQLAERISESLKKRSGNAASDDLDEMSSRLSKVASYIDRDLTGSSDNIFLDHKKIRHLQKDIGFLHKVFGSLGEIFVSKQRLLNGIKNRQWRFAWIFRMSGLLMGAVSVVLGGFTFVGAKGVRLNEEHQCWVADADIIGDGVRAGTWSQGAILFLSTFLGSFHHSHTAIKELGSGLLGMHVSLALAFFGPLVQSELSPVDAILGSMVLDVQNSALSMQLMEKETLAARWQVGAVMVAQLLGLVTIGIIMHSFTQDKLAVDSCKCFSAFWWSWFSNCPTGYSSQVFPFWIYYSLRCLSTAHSWLLSLSKTASYDDALKWEDDNLSRLCQSCRNRNRSDDLASPCKCKACTESSSACDNCGRLACCLERKMRCETLPRL